MRSAGRGGRVLDRGGDAGQLGVAARVGSGGAALVTRVAVRHRRPRQAGLARRGAGRGVQDTADHVDVPDAAAGGSADATGRPRSLPATIAVGAVRARPPTAASDWRTTGRPEGRRWHVRIARPAELFSAGSSRREGWAGFRSRCMLRCMRSACQLLRLLLRSLPRRLLLSKVTTYHLS